MSFKIKYIKGSLFDAPKGGLLIHACNAKGVWGSGIALEFKKQFPEAYIKYEDFCSRYNGVTKSPIVKEKQGHRIKQRIGCLITSSGYADTLDTKDEILVNTTLCLNYLCTFDYSFDDPKKLKISSNKFNSGLFKVPWEDTEKILAVFVKKYNLDWTVYEL